VLGWGRYPVLGFLGAILILGLSGIIAQLLLLRELLITFLSNELSIGITLANWLILEAAGSYLAGRGVEKAKNSVPAFVALTLLFSMTFPLSVYLARTWKGIIGVSPGEGLGLEQIFYSSFLILLPVSLSHGALFTVACKIDAAFSKQEASGIGRIYFLEIVGTLAGGLVFAYLLITRLTSFQIALGVSLLNIMVCVWLLRLRRGMASICNREREGERPVLNSLLSGASVILLALSAYAVFGPPAERVHERSIQKQWQSQDVVHYENSIYGNVTVIQREGQYTFFSGGIPVITAPTPDIIFVEEFAHLPMLFHSHPKEILVISGGAGGVIHELLKHPVESVHYAELDPLILRLVKRFSTPLTDAELADPRVRVHYVDGRLFLKETSVLFDVVFVGLSNPQDLQTNRFFTREFFALAKKKLKPEGIVAFSLPGSTTYMSKELRNLNACIINTLKDVYPGVRFIPGDGFNLVLASPSQNLSSVGMDGVIRRFEDADLAVRLLTPAHIRYKLDARWSRWFSDSLRDATDRINEDFKPLGVYYSLSHWNALFSPGLQRVFARIENVNFKHIIAFLTVIAVVFIALCVRLKALAKASMPVAIASTGFAGMILELALIFTFQALYGFVFFWVGLLVTAFMAGTAVGSFAVTSLMERMRKDVAFFLKIEVAMVMFSGLLPLIFLGLSPYLDRPVAKLFPQMVFLGLSILAGMLIGMEFPLASKIYLNFSRNVGGTVGLLYAADLLGGWAGGIVGGVALLPVLGLVETCLIVGVLKLISVVVILMSILKLDTFLTT
jgi:spermidine synthase